MSRKYKISVIEWKCPNTKCNKCLTIETDIIQTKKPRSPDCSRIMKEKIISGEGNEKEDTKLRKL